jgi:hypothetical protein
VSVMRRADRSGRASRQREALLAFLFCTGGCSDLRATQLRLNGNAHLHGLPVLRPGGHIGVLGDVPPMGAS